jgi:osmotically-inducible protein OsmY
MVSTSYGQNGPLQQIGRGLENAGRNVRNIVETEVARGQITAQERDVLGRVSRRIEWDKQMVGSTIQLEAQSGGVLIIRGSVMNPAAKLRAIDLVQSTIGVATVVDQLAVVKEVKVIAAPPVPTVIESSPEKK